MVHRPFGTVCCSQLNGAHYVTSGASSGSQWTQLPPGVAAVSALLQEEWHALDARGLGALAMSCKDIVHDILLLVDGSICSCVLGPTIEVLCPNEVIWEASCFPDAPHAAA